MTQRGIVALFILIVTTSGILLLGSLTLGHNWGGDFSAYIMQAKSIAEGAPSSFLESNRFTVEQSTHPVGPTAYPWGFPVLLAPFYAMFGLNLLALKSVSVLSYLLFLVVLWFAFRGDHTTTWLMCLLGLFAFNPTLIAFSNNILSDVPFLLVSTICISAIREIVNKNNFIISRRTDLILLGGGIALAFVIRTNGILLIVTLVLSHCISNLTKQSPSEQPQETTGAHQLWGHSFLARRPSAKSIAQLLIPCAVFVCFITIWRLLFPDGGDYYISYFKNISAGMIINHLSYYLDLPTAFFYGAPHSRLLYGASIPLAIVGAFRRFRRDYHAIIYIALTVLLYIFWPANQGIRFLFPILPFYISFVCSGLEAFGGGTTEPEVSLRKAVSCVPVVLVVLFFLFNDIRSMNWHIIKNVTITSGPFAPTSQQMFSFVVDHTDPRSIIIFFKPRVMRLMTGRQSIMINRAEQLSRGDYLCLYLRKGARGQVSGDDVRRLLAQKDIRIVYKNEDFNVYRLNKNEDIPAHNNVMHSDGNSAALHFHR